MDKNAFEKERKFVDTPSGRVSYVEQGEGPVALFVHGVLLNGYLWRHQLAELVTIRRCIAVDLLAHGATVRAHDRAATSCWARRCGRVSWRRTELMARGGYGTMSWRRGGTTHSAARLGK